MVEAWWKKVHEAHFVDAFLKEVGKAGVSPLGERWPDESGNLSGTAERASVSFIETGAFLFSN